MIWYFIFFFISGFCSVLYELVWLRLSMAQFGVTTAMVSIVLSVFMAGLGLGSWAGGRWLRQSDDTASFPALQASNFSSACRASSCPLRCCGATTFSGSRLDRGGIRAAGLKGADPGKGAIAPNYVTYSKAGSAEKRELDIYAAKDGSNRFVLEARPSGATFTGDNVDISKRFMMLQCRRTGVN